MKILILSLLRLGDIILTTPMINGLKSMYPTSQVDLLLNRQFHSVVSILNGINNFYFFDREEIQEASRDSTRALFEPYLRITRLIEKLNACQYDLIVNLTQTRLSGYLMNMIQAGEKSGFYFDSCLNPVFSNDWYKYINEHMPSGCSSQFHMVDAFCNAIGYSKGPRLMSVNSHKKISKDYLNFFENKYCVVQPLTSDEKKNWGFDNFKNTLHIFQKMCPDIEIVLLAAPFEEGRIQILNQALTKENIKVKIIISSLDEAYHVISFAELLLTLDTSIKHLAAATSCKIIEICLGSSQYQKTGVYAEGAYILQPITQCIPCHHDLNCHQLDHLCGKKLDPMSVALMMKYVLDNNISYIEKLAEMNKSKFKILTTHLPQNGGSWFVTDQVMNG